MTLSDSLRKNLAGRVPMHMPGHKRNSLLAPYLSELGAELDVTEIPGFDNLHAPQGVLQDAMHRAAALYGAHGSFFLVGGSTAGILAGVRALSAAGGDILMQRGSHMAVHHAAALCELTPRYLREPVEPKTGLTGPIGPRALEEALAQHPSVRLLVLTSPTYAGVLSDLPALVSIAHKRGIKVLVDAAHGAHLGLHPAFPQGAVASGADIVVQSLHKTLPSLTQTAIAHVSCDEVADRMAEQLDIFQTSSPSYLLMASIDGCVELLAHKGEELFCAWQARLAAFTQQVSGLKHLCLGHEQHVWPVDPGKLIISCHRADITGEALQSRLGDTYGIDVELADERTMLAMTGMGDTPQMLDYFAQSLLAVDAQLHFCQKPSMHPLELPDAIMPPHRALRQPSLRVPFAGAKARICAEFVTIYPPGVPLLVPGERIGPAQVEQMRKAGGLVKSRSKNHNGFVDVLHDL